MHAFTELISETRTANSHSGAAKARSYELFVKLYEQGDQQIHDFLTDFADKLGSIMHKWYVFPHLKDRRVLLFLAEINHLLKEVIAEHNKRHKRPITVDPDELTRELYTALNPTFGDTWRRIALILGAGASLLILFLLTKLVSAIYKASVGIEKVSLSVANIEQTLTKIDPQVAKRLTQEITIFMQANREYDAETLKQTGAKPEGSIKKLAAFLQYTTEQKLLEALVPLLQQANSNSGEGNIKKIINLLSGLTKQ